MNVVLDNESCRLTILERVNVTTFGLDKSEIGEDLKIVFNLSGFKRIRPFIDEIKDSKVYGY